MRRMSDTSRLSGTVGGPVTASAPSRLADRVDDNLNPRHRLLVQLRSRQYARPAWGREPGNPVSACVLYGPGLNHERRDRPYSPLRLARAL